MMEAELHLMGMVDGDKVSGVARLRMYICNELGVCQGSISHKQ